MPNLDLDAIEARAERATKGPWKYVSVYDEVLSLAVDGKREGVCCTWSSDGDVFHGVNQDNNADFIANARDDVPALVARVREFEEENAKLREKRLSNLESAERMTDRVERLTNDNAALRLAATELYEFVTRDCGFEPKYGVVERMANVLGLKTKGEGAE